jgi:hypothetical protein
VSPGEIAAIVTSVVAALIVAVFSYLGVRRTLEAQERRELRSREEEAERLLRRYRDPVVRAAFDLQSRLYNIVVNDFLTKYLVRGTPAEQEYAVESSLYVIGEYFGWVEVLRQEVQFLDLGDAGKSRELRERLGAINGIFFSERPDPAFRIFRGEQRAIGQVMVETSSGSGGREVIGYADFVTRRRSPDFARWFEKLDADVRQLARGSDARPDRLIDVQQALIGLLAFLDPDNQYFPESRRQLIPHDATASEPAVPAEPPED